MRMNTGVVKVLVGVYGCLLLALALFCLGSHVMMKSGNVVVRGYGEKLYDEGVSMISYLIVPVYILFWRVPKYTVNTAYDGVVGMWEMFLVMLKRMYEGWIFVKDEFILPCLLEIVRVIKVVYSQYLVPFMQECYRLYLMVINDYFVPFVDFIYNRFVDPFLTAVSQFLEYVYNTVTKILETIKSYFSGKFLYIWRTYVVPVLQIIGDTITYYVRIICDFIASLWNTLMSYITYYLEKIVDFTEYYGTIILEALKEFFTITWAHIKYYGIIVKENLMFYWDIVSTIVVHYWHIVWDFLIMIIKETINDIIDYSTRICEWLWDIIYPIRMVIHFIYTKFMEFVNWFIDMIVFMYHDMIIPILSFITNLIVQVSSFVNDIFWQVMNQISIVISYITTLISDAIHLTQSIISRISEVILHILENSRQHITEIITALYEWTEKFSQ